MTIEWRKSSRSGGVNDEMCVEVTRLPEGSSIKDRASTPDNRSTQEFA
jgi:hypothetical protein